MGRFVAWFVLLLTAVFLETTGGTYPGIASILAAIPTQVLAVLILGGWCAVALVRPTWRPTTTLIGPVLLVVGAWCLSALFSQRPRLSLEPAIAGVGFVLGFLCLTRVLADPWFRRRIGSLVVIGVALVAGAYIVQVVATWVEWWSLVQAIAVPPLRPAFAALLFGSPNLVATFLIVTAPLAVAILAGRSTRRRAPVGLAVLAGIALVLTGSRGAYLGVGIGVLVGLVLAASRVDLRSAARSAGAQFRRRPILLAPVVLVVAAAAVLGPVIARRFAQGGDTLRLDLWRSALTIFGEHPLTGGGPGTWVQLKTAANPAGAPNVILQHAHDLYVQTAAEVGIVGLVALAILVVAVARHLVAAWTADGGPEAGGALEAGAVIVALTAFAGQSLVDNFVNLPSMVILLLIVVAWVEASSAASATAASTNARVVRRLSAALPIAGLLGLVIAVPVLARIDAAGLASLAGNDAALRLDWATALARYDDALALDGDNTLYQLERVGMLARVGRLAEARDQLTIAVASDPVAENVMTLAQLELATGDPAAARAHATQALALGPGEPILSLNSGAIAEVSNDAGLALEEYADAIAGDPAIAGSPYWLDPGRTVKKADVITAAEARTDPTSAALIQAYGGDAAGAIAALSALPSSELRDAYLAAADWLNGDVASAFAVLKARLASDPQSWFSAGWLSRIGRLSSYPEEGARYARWATIIEADAADSAVTEASLVPAVPGDPSAGPPANYPWSVYLRPIPPFLYPTQLLTIGTR